MSTQPIPLQDFQSIHSREEISENISSFIGKRVVDYDPDKPAKSDVVYRFRSDWDNDELLPNLQHFLDTDAAADAPGIVIGAWHSDDPQMTSAKVIEFLAQSAAKLPSLAGIYIGDITSEENEMSWIQQSDLSPLLQAFPNLQMLRARGGEGLKLSQPKHAKLRGLALETGGMSVEVIRSIGASEFPALEHLELWLGTDEYGADYTVPDLQPILSGARFPSLKYLGLRNCQAADELAAVVVNSPLMTQIETLDLSLGVLTDDGARALLMMPLDSTVKNLNLHYNYISQELIHQLKALPMAVDVSRPSDLDLNDEWRFVAVGE